MVYTRITQDLGLAYVTASLEGLEDVAGDWPRRPGVLSRTSTTAPCLDETALIRAVRPKTLCTFEFISVIPKGAILSLLHVPPMQST